MSKTTTIKCDQTGEVLQESDPWVITLTGDIRKLVGGILLPGALTRSYHFKNVGAFYEWMEERVDKMRTNEQRLRPKSFSSEAPYGYCPICGAKGTFRERRPDGNDRCENDHVYPSRLALNVKAEAEERGKLMKPFLRSAEELEELRKERADASE